MIYKSPTLLPHLRLQSQWTHVLDCVGLALGLGAVVPQLARAQSQNFLALVASVAFIVWLFRVREPKTFRLQYSAFELLEVPLSAALLTLIVSALTRSYYSGSALTLFVLVWSAWLVASRLAFRRFIPPVRTLLIGNPSFAAELHAQERLRLTIVNTPPETFDRWDVIVVESTKLYSEAWLQWLAHADIAGVQVISALAFSETVTGRVSTEVLNGRWAPLVLHGRSPYTQAKRLFDVSVTLLLLPLLLPLAGFVALAVYLDGGRPVLFWQERVGKGGIPFQMVKFRSMRRDSEASGAAFAAQQDLRVTRIGAFLRKYRLDELPQFYNVLRGEMSIIGPRPKQEVFVKLFSESIPLYAIRHHVRPGITGWAQVRQGYTANAEETREKLRCDFYYIKNFSLELDLKSSGQPS